MSHHDLLRIGCALLAGVPATTSWGQDLYAGPAYPIAVGNPLDVRLVDVNGDAKLDLVATGWTYLSFGNPDAISIRMGTGTGQFGPLEAIPVDITPNRVVAADFDGDADVDLAVSNWIGGTVAIFAGDGSGSFAAPSTVSTVITPVDLAAGDWNGDGKVDLLVSGGTGVVKLLLGNGAGSFVPLAAAPAGGSGFVAPCDANGDGKLDVVVAYSTATSDAIRVLTGTGFGGFSLGPAWPTGTAPIELELGDLDEDGKTDVVTASLLDATASVHLADGLGGFAPVATFATALPSRALSLGDFDGDGHLDLATANAHPSPGPDIPGWGEAHVARGDGAGHFTTTSMVPTGLDPRTLAAGDLDGDGADDLAIGNDWSGTVSIARGGKSMVVASFFDSGSPANGLQLGDLDGDGNLDLVHFRAQDPSFRVHLGDPIRGFSPPVSFPVGGTSPRAIELGDVDHDGVLDVVALDASHVCVSLGDGAGAFAMPAAFDVGGVGPTSIVLGDLDGDGNLDAATSNDGSGDVSVLLGDGVGGLGAAIPIAAGPGPESLGVADLDGDGANDLVVGRNVYGGPSIESSIAVLLADGRAHFASPVTYPTASGSVELAVGDLDRDGDPDVFLTVNQFLRNDGTGALEVGPAPPVLGPWCRSPRVVDIDGDGIADVAGIEGPHAAVRKHVVEPDGEPLLYSIAPGSIVQKTAIAAGDLDQDGLPDLLALSSGTVVPLLSPPRGSVLLQRTPTPRGIHAFGKGTPGCAGAVALTANSDPTSGNSGFAILAASAPPAAPGFALLADVGDLAGSDPIGLGVVFHVDLASATDAFAIDFGSGPGGAALASMPIPSSSALVGSRWNAQGFWVEIAGFACSSASIPVVSSTGLTLEILP